MQAMLRQFRGLEVDWARGAVRHVHGRWRQMSLDGGFWRDLVWWRSAMRRANCTSMASPAVGEAAVTGSDASDYACGELVWLDGARGVRAREGVLCVDASSQGRARTTQQPCPHEQVLRASELR